MSTPGQVSALTAAQQQVADALKQDQPAKTTRMLTHVLEDLVAIPGTKLRVGLDPVLSIAPWVGTAVGAIFGTVLMIDAIRLRTPLSVLARMLGNWFIDWFVGLFPYAGPLLDLAWRSNKKNLALLNRTIDNREQVRDATIRYWITAGAVVALMIALLLLVPVVLLMLLFRAG